MNKENPMSNARLGFAVSNPANAKTGLVDMFDKGSCRHWSLSGGHWGFAAHFS